MIFFKKPIFIVKRILHYWKFNLGDKRVVVQYVANYHLVNYLLSLVNFAHF